METRTATLTRRSFSLWLTASGLAVATSRHTPAQSTPEAAITTDGQWSERPSAIAIESSKIESWGQASPERRSQEGRPPSEWLRSMDTEELRTWLAEIELPEAGVLGMTFWTHLTRDHMFQPLLIKGLTEAEQAKLHAAAHFGY